MTHETTPRSRRGADDEADVVRTGTGLDAPVGRSRLLTVDEAAEYLGVSQRWLYDQVRSGRLRALYIARSWRIRPADVDAFADSFAWSPASR